MLEVFKKMPEFLSNLLEQLKGIWGNLTFVRKIVVVLMGFAILIALLALVFLSNRGFEYKALYSSLSAEDLTDIEMALEDNGILYKSSEDGQNILVPIDQIRQARIWLARKGLPRDESIGFGLFDESKFGMTDFTQHVQYKRALQGELANTLAQIDKISKARVHLVIPRPSVFVEEEKPAKASVLLTITSGKQLNKADIDGIVRLVASGVEDLKLEDVELIDNSDGSRINKEEPTLADSINDQLKWQKTIETAYRERIETMLAPVLGPNGRDRLRAEVTVEMDFDTIEATKEEYDPYTIIDSEQRVKETTERIVQAVGGAPGMGSNVNVNTDPNVQPPGLPQAEENIINDRIPLRETKEDTTTTYLVGRSSVKTKKSAGAIKRVTASVVVGNKPSAEGDKPSQPWTDVELKNLEHIIKTAVGYNLTRGDVVNVKNFPFPDDLLAVAKREIPQKDIEERKRLYRTLAQLTFGLTVVIFAYFMVVRPLFKGIGKMIAPEPEMLEPTIEEEVEEGEPELTPEQLRARVMPAIFSEEMLDLEALKAVADEKPEQIESLIMHWLEEDLIV